MADKSEKSRKFSPKFSSRIRQKLLTKAEGLDGQLVSDHDFFLQDPFADEFEDSSCEASSDSDCEQTIGEFINTADSAVSDTKCVTADSSLLELGLEYITGVQNKDLEKLRQSVEARVIAWLRDSPDTAVSQGKWVLEHPSPTIDQRCFALKLLLLTGTKEANAVLMSYYRTHASNSSWIGILTFDEWNSVGITADPKAAHAEVIETTDDPKNLFKLGREYQLNRTPLDLKQALDCYTRAAELGLAEAQYQLGEIYSDSDRLSNWDVRLNMSTAVAWYRKAASQGHSSAQCMLGKMYEDGRGVPQDNQQAESYYLLAALQDDEESQAWLWRRDRSEREMRPAPPIYIAEPSPSMGHTFTLPHESAVALVRVAIDLLKQNPTLFLPELAELRNLGFENNAAAPSQVVPSEVSPLSGDTPSLAKVAKWLLAQESVTLIALRAHLLPLDLLPSAVIDELNELALDSIGEPALEENDGETVLVAREILAQVLACWDVA